MEKPTDIETLYIDFDSFFASVEQQLVPAYRHRPMGVLPLDSPYSGCIAVSREAKALGIKRGVRPIDVRATCSDFLVTVARHDVYIAMHHKILRAVGKTLPIHKVWSIDEVECRLMGNERQDWLRLAVEIRDNLAADIGPFITPSIGFGPNQLLAKIAVEMEKPNGLVCLHPQDLPHMLHGLNMGDIPGIGRRMKTRLACAGIVSVRQLLGLSGKQMRALWGSVEGERLWAGLHGYRTERAETTRNMFGHGRILSPSWRNIEGARNCARLLLVKAGRRLRRQNFAATYVSIRVGFKDKTKRKQVRKLTVPSIDDQSFLTALEDMLAQIWQQQTRNTPIQVAVCLYGLIAQDLRCEDLLETHNIRANRKRWEEIGAIVDGLNSHYARTCISLGTYIEPPGGYAGSKIAFGRIPMFRILFNLIEVTWLERAVEGKGRDINIIVLTVQGFHTVTSHHHARWGRQGRARCIAEGFARFEGWHFANYAFAAHFLYLSIAVGNAPEPFDHLQLFLALIFNFN